MFVARDPVIYFSRRDTALEPTWMRSLVEQDAGIRSIAVLCVVSVNPKTPSGLVDARMHVAIFIGIAFHISGNIHPYLIRFFRPGL